MGYGIDIGRIRNTLWNGHRIASHHSNALEMNVLRMCSNLKEIAENCLSERLKA